MPIVRRQDRIISGMQMYEASPCSSCLFSLIFRECGHLVYGDPVPLFNAVSVDVDLAKTLHVLRVVLAAVKDARVEDIASAGVTDSVSRGTM